MAVHVVDDLGELLTSIREDPARRAELIPLLHESASIYAGRGSAACGRIRARILATFGEVGLPVTALPFVIEALRTDLNPEIVAGAAIAARGLAGSDGDLGRALVQALDNLRGRDAPVALLSGGAESTALLEVLASLRWQPTVTPDLLDAVRVLHDQHASGWSVRVRSAARQTVADLAARAHRFSLALDEVSPPMIMEEATETGGDLLQVTVQDHDGRIQPLTDYLGRAATVVAFFYTRCQNPNKCSLTITKLGDLQRCLDDLGVAAIQLAAITYDPGFDLPNRLAAYARTRGMILGDTVRMLRAVEGHDQLRRFFGLRVGYNGSIVNQHGVELYLVDSGLQIVRTWARVPWNVDDVAEALING